MNEIAAGLANAQISQDLRNNGVLGIARTLNFFTDSIVRAFARAQCCAYCPDEEPNSEP